MFCYLNSVHSSVIPPQKKSSHCHCVVAHGVPQATNETMDVGDEINHGGFLRKMGFCIFGLKLTTFHSALHGAETKFKRRFGKWIILYFFWLNSTSLG
jgi:hypothetical protein